MSWIVHLSHNFYLRHEIATWIVIVNCRLEYRWPMQLRHSCDSSFFGLLTIKFHSVSNVYFGNRFSHKTRPIPYFKDASRPASHYGTVPQSRRCINRLSPLVGRTIGPLDWTNGIRRSILRWAVESDATGSQTRCRHLTVDLFAGRLSVFAARRRCVARRDKFILTWCVVNVAKYYKILDDRTNII